MSVLLIDIGNSRVKWVRDVKGRLGRVRAATLEGWTGGDFQKLIGSTARINRMLVCSVAGPAIEKALKLAARRSGAPAPEFVATQRRACGVTVGYLEPWRLGVDRFLAMIGAREAYPRRPLCIVGVGTAMTIDLLGADGLHHGGAIIPAPGLMAKCLFERTTGIRRRAQGGAPGRGPALFGHSTRAAVEQGTRFAAAATVERAVTEARALVGRVPKVLLTGGGASDLQSLIRGASALAPELVLQGLAVWAREG